MHFTVLFIRVSISHAISCEDCFSNDVNYVWWRIVKLSLHIHPSSSIATDTVAISLCQTFKFVLLLQFVLFLCERKSRCWYFCPFTRGSSASEWCSLSVNIVVKELLLVRIRFSHIINILPACVQCNRKARCVEVSFSGVWLTEYWNIWNISSGLFRCYTFDFEPCWDFVASRDPGVSAFTYSVPKSVIFFDLPFTLRHCVD